MGGFSFITRVRLQNYKSIGLCDVHLGALTFLVGPNGAGKSNFLDALRFVAEALRTTLDHALRDRGGIGEVRRRSGGHPNHFAVKVDFSLEDAAGSYSFRIGARPRGAYEVQKEECRIVPVLPGVARPAYYSVESGEVRQCSAPAYPPAAVDRLYLLNASGLPEFRVLYDALSSMGFYNLNPDKIRELQSPDPGSILARDGSNITSVFENLTRDSDLARRRVTEYLEQVVPGVRGVDVKVLGPKQTLEFRQTVAGSRDPWRFLAANMSDGTLRAFGVLVALFQTANGKGAIRLVGIEEPETALHPGAAGALLDSLSEACLKTQVIVTSHSPDILDRFEIPGEIIAVRADSGSTKLAPLDEATRSTLIDRLYTVGELMRADQLKPDSGYLDELDKRQARLFEDDSVN
jgi:predicted ATPase